jgi:hypothetical protein
MSQLLDPLVQSLNETWRQVQLFFPRVFAAVVLLALGWILASIVRRLLIRLLLALRVDVAAEKAGIEDFLLRGGVRFTTVTLIAQVLYWGLFLVVVLAAFNVVGVPMPTSTIEQVAGYLPNVMAALLVVIFGSLLARFARAALQAYLDNIGMEGAELFALLAQGAIMVFVATLALGQLRIGGPVLVSAFQIAFGGLCLALALAFGLGGRDWAARILDRAGKGK